MFSNDSQRARACRGLLVLVGLEHLWANDGPTREASRLLEQNGASLTESQRIVFLAAWEFCDHPTTLRVFDLLRVLDAERLSAVCSLMMAVRQGGIYIDEWLDTYGLPGDRS